MGKVLHAITRLFQQPTERDRKLRRAVGLLLGTTPSNFELYRLAFMHHSVSQLVSGKELRLSNERLEYLGDSVLGMVIAEHLFKKYPYKDEGFLTEIRSRIVNRDSLNQLARKLGFEELIEYDVRQRGIGVHSSMYGDALEAFVGAIYLDKGFTFTKRFILSRLLSSYFDLDKVVETNANFKSQLIEWAQRQGRPLKFAGSEQGPARHREFVTEVLLDGQVVARASGFTKKKSEQLAAQRALESLETHA